MEDSIQQQVLAWYEEYYDDLYRFIFFTLGDQHLCEDFVHDTFVRAYKSVNQFENRSSAKTWLFGIAKHIVLDEIRKRKRRKVFAFFQDREYPSPFNMEDYVENRELIERMIATIQKLKPEYRLVITLKKIEECSTKEISDILGWSDAKVRKTLSRALKALREKEISERGDNIEQPIQR